MEADARRAAPGIEAATRVNPTSRPHLPVGLDSVLDGVLDDDVRDGSLSQSNPISRCKSGEASPGIHAHAETKRSAPPWPPWPRRFKLGGP